jgi:tetratricopeptide (TPR) repeat protein
MKRLRNYFYAFLTVAFIGQFNLNAQSKEIPVTTSSKEALSFFQTGRDKIENLELVAAASLFDKAIEKDPQFGLAYLYRAQSGGGFNVARQNMEKAVTLSEKLSEGERLLISYYKANNEGDGQKQKESLDKLLSSYPSDKRVHAVAGEYYYGINDFQQSLDHFRKSSEIDPDYAPVYNMIGYCQSALGNFQSAEKAFQNYIKLVPNNPNPYDSYGELLLKTGKYDESIVQYKKALEKDPSFSTANAGIGNNYVFKGDYTSARKHYQDYYDNSPVVSGKLDALFLKAVSYVYEGKSEDALTSFDEYRALAEQEKLIPNAVRSYAFQGFTLTESGKPAEATKYFEKADNLIRESTLPESTKENLTTNSMLWKFYYLTANNELDKAMAQAENCKAKVESRKNPGEQMFFNSLLGFYEIKKGDYDKALGYLSKGDTQDPWNWYYTAMAYNKKGDKPNSIRLYDKITNWNVSSLNHAFIRQHAIEENNKLAGR